MIEAATKDKIELVVGSEFIDKPLKPVLDKGYVRYIDRMGDDLRVANAARLSFEKWKEEFDEKDANLINFLWREEHTSPFRHPMMCFVFRAPLMVARQHWKYVVGSDHTMDAWNEASRRYVNEKEEFYVPKFDEWRSQPDNKKQGSGEPVDEFTGAVAFQRLMDTVQVAEDNYAWAKANNICAEQARLYLPAYGLYVTYMWTASLQSVMHFVRQRVAHDAQKEIADYAKSVAYFAEQIFPVCFRVAGLT